jgi:hypothetical protein
MPPHGGLTQILRDRAARLPIQADVESDGPLEPPVPPRDAGRISANDGRSDSLCGGGFA